MGNQSPQLSTGISASTGAGDDSDFVSNPNYTAPSSDFVDNPQYKPQDVSPQDSDQQPQSDELRFTGNEGFGEGLAKGVGGILEGAGEGIFGTIAGGADLLGAKGTAASQELHKLAGDENTSHGLPQEIGGGLETIGEFMLGDLAAVKGLTVADKLGVTSKLLKTLDGFPKVQRALQLGINIGKAGTELSQEERDLLKAHPVMARLIGAGYAALRQGVVQGVQTGVKTGGDVGEATKSGLEMAGGSGVVGVGTGLVGGLLAKGGEAAANAGALQDAAKAAPTATEANTQLGQTVQNAVQPAINAAQATKDEAESKLAGGSGAISGVIENAPTKEQISTNAQAHAKAGEQAIRDAYTQASEAIRNDPALDGLTIQGKGSAFQDKAAESAFGKQSGDAIQKALGAAIPASPDVMNLANNLAKPDGLLELDEAGNPKEMDINNLLDYAKNIKEKIRSIGYSTPQDMRDRQVYYNLLDGVHQSVEDLVNKSGKPELMDDVAKMNEDYRQGIQTFKNPDVQAILRGSNENSIINTLTGGKSVSDIQAIKKAIGPKAFASLSDDAMSRLAADSTNPATGEFDMKRWIRSMTNIPTDVRSEMFNDTKKSGALENILRQTQQVNGSGAIENSEQAIAQSEKTVKDILGGNPDISELLTKPEKVLQLSQTIGPDAMGELGDTILKNQLREASTKGSGEIGPVNTGQFLRFVESLKDSPEVVDAFFKPTPERAAAYDKLLGSIHNVEGVKNMIKVGLIAPAIGAGVGGAVGHSMFSAILGSMAAEGAGGYFSKARDFLDTVANHPAMWKSLGAISSASQSGTAKAAANLGRIAAGKAAPKLLDILKGASGSLAGQ